MFDMKTAVEDRKQLIAAHVDVVESSSNQVSSVAVVVEVVDIDDTSDFVVYWAVYRMALIEHYHPNPDV